jgi:hypothetical protein
MATVKMLFNFELLYEITFTAWLKELNQYHQTRKLNLNYFGEFPAFFVLISHLVHRLL